MAEQAQKKAQETAQQATQTAGSAATGTAVKAAAAAAATGVAALAAKKALSGRGHVNGEAKNGAPSSPAGSESVFSSMVSGGWEAARDSLIPVAEDAAGAAGEYLARSAPDVVRERIVPRFISSFNEASGAS